MAFNVMWLTNQIRRQIKIRVNRGLVYKCVDADNKEAFLHLVQDVIESQAKAEDDEKNKKLKKEDKKKLDITYITNKADLQLTLAGLYEFVDYVESFYELKDLIDVYKKEENRRLLLRSLHLDNSEDSKCIK